MTNEGTAEIAKKIPISEHMASSDAIVYLLYGFGVVLITLALLWGITSLIGVLLKKLGLNKKPVTKPKTKLTVIPPEIIAVITAAVSFATGGQASIREINRKN